MSAELCAHCAVAIPPGALVADRVAGRELAFCCTGCAGAYRIITGAGLADFYRRRRWSQGGTPEGAFGAAFGDDFLARFVRHDEAGAEITLLVEGVRCGSCVWLLEKVLARVPGVERARVNFATHRAAVRYDPQATSPAALFQAVSELGYLPRPFTPSQADEAAARERRSVLVRLGTSTFLSMQLMAYSVGLYAGYFQGMEEGTKRLLEWLSAGVATPVVLYGGWPFFRGALRSLRNRSADMDLLVSLGVGAAYLYSLYALAAGLEVYFDSAATIVSLLLAGRLLELGARRRASAGIDRLLRLLPDSARRVEGGELVEVSSATLRPGDLVLVRPGERFPADGEVIEGETEADEAAVTGEPAPVLRGVGDPVTSGTLNTTSAVTLRVRAAAGDSFVGRVARLVEEAQARKAPVQALADRLSGLFVPLVVLAAAGTWGFWSLAGGGRVEALLNAVSVLIVACPCALGLATPAAVLVASGAAARGGILFRGGDVLEALARVDVVAFDKTGTLTEGRPRVVAFRPSGTTAEGLLALAAAAEAGSSHPLARAVIDAARAAGVPVGTGGGAVVRSGRGVELSTPEGLLRVGSALFASEGGARVPEETAGSPGGATEAHVALGDAYRGSFLLEDALRCDASGAVARLRRLGLRTVLLTGDRAEAGERVARRAGIEEVRAGLSPEEKAAFLRACQERGHSALMVGDGVNDAPALSTAAVGCALAGGADLALETSDLVLTRPAPGRVADALILARRTLRVIRQNLFWAFFYNVLAIPLAAAGRLAPVYAAAAMAASSACVLGNSLRLARGAGGPGREESA